MDNQHLLKIRKDKIKMKKLELSEIKTRIEERFPNEKFEIINYDGMGSPGSVKCCNCGKIIFINRFGNFLAPSKKYGCSECQSILKIKQKENMEEILKYYDIIDSFVKDTHTNYVCKCKNCGHLRTTTLKNLTNSLECGCVTGVKRNRTPEEFLKEVNENSSKGKYTLIGEYKNQTKPVLLRHDCGFIWKARPADVVHGRSLCPKCARTRSKGELFIENLLKEYNIDYQAEKRLENSLQRFDFYLENDKKKIAIEYNGAQHYIETNYFNADLKTFQERDKKKSEYCKQNNIELFIIPYTSSKEEIIKIIQEIVNKFNDQSI